MRVVLRSSSGTVECINDTRWVDEKTNLSDKRPITLQRFVRASMSSFGFFHPPPSIYHNQTLPSPSSPHLIAHPTHRASTITMPRSGRGSAGPAPKRPTAAPARPAAPAQQPSQARQSSTAAYPTAAQRAPVPAQTQAPAQQSGGPGLFGQMASTAA